MGEGDAPWTNMTGSAGMSVHGHKKTSKQEESIDLGSIFDYLKESSLFTVI